MWHILCSDFNSCRRILKDFFVIKVEPEQFPCPQSYSLSLSPQLLTGSARSLHWQNWKFFFPSHLPGAALAHAIGSCFFWCHALTSARYLHKMFGALQSALQFCLFVCLFVISFYFPDCMKQSPKRLSESPGFAWCCRKIESHLKTPFPAQLLSQSWIRTSLWWLAILFPGWIYLWPVCVCFLFWQVHSLLQELKYLPNLLVEGTFLPRSNLVGVNKPNSYRFLVEKPLFSPF